MKFLLSWSEYDKMIFLPHIAIIFGNEANDEDNLRYKIYGLELGLLNFSFVIGGCIILEDN